MAGFRKAEGKQAALKVAMYGPPGSGKTFTALLVAEGLAKVTGKRIAYVDTERGTDFYAQAVPSRAVHPEAFEFDALYTKSLTEVLKEVKALDPTVYGVVVLDSISHLWDAAISAFTGRQTRAGTIPMNAWGKIKAPYKELMANLINSQTHVFILGRQANEFDKDEQGELVSVGLKMRAEKETAYEPHVCIRMEAVRAKQGKTRLEAVPTAVIEKDRTGVLSGKSIPWPSFDSLAKPLLPLLGGVQAQLPSDDEAALVDGENLARADRDREQESRKTRERLEARLKLCETAEAVESIGREITAPLKARMLKPDVDALRESYLEALGRSRSNGQAKQPV